MSYIRKKHKAEMDMCSGPLFSRIIVFAIPLILSGVLQVLYNAADQAVVGQFADSDALAAVGSTAPLFNLLVCLVSGLSVGTSTVVARLYGAQDSPSVSRAVHSSMVLAILSSIVMGSIGFIFAEPLLVMMDTDKEVLAEATLYIRILFVGLPAVTVYNFGSAVLRAVGDSKRPMIFLIISGAINVLLNMLFVIVFHMRADGVAYATIISQVVSAVMTVVCLMRSEGNYKLVLKKLKMHKSETLQIIRIGVPAAIQTSMFSISNVILQSAVNSLGKAAVSGGAAGSTIEGITYQAMHAIYLAALSFCGQNYGAKNYKRLLRALLYCYGIVTVIGLIVGIVSYLLRYPLMHIFIKENPEAVELGILRLKNTVLPYFLCGIMDVGAAALRSINRPIQSLLCSVVCVCGVRILWIHTVFKMFPSMDVLFFSYPLTWFLTAVLYILMFVVFFKKLLKENI